MYVVWEPDGILAGLFRLQTSLWFESEILGRLCDRVYRMNKTAELHGSKCKPNVRDTKQMEN